MILPFSHDAMEVRQQDALAGVDGFVSVPSLNVSVRPRLVSVGKPDPINTNLLAHVQKVGRIVNIAKVGYAIVSRVVIDVINNLGLFAVDKKPRNPVSHISNAVVRKKCVALSVRPSSALAGELPGRVVKMPCVGVIPQLREHSVGDWVRLHLASLPYKLGKSYHER